MCVCVCNLLLLRVFFDGIFLVVVSLKPKANFGTYVVSLSDHDESKSITPFLVLRGHSEFATR